MNSKKASDMKILVKGNLIAEDFISNDKNGCFTYGTDGIDETDFDLIVYGDMNVKGLYYVAERVEIHVTGFVTALGLGCPGTEPRGHSHQTNKEI